jgi:hypothetical protein
MTYQRICNKSNITGATRGTGTAYPVSAHEFTPVFGEVRVARSLVFCIMLCRSLFVFLVLFPLGIVLSVLRIADSGIIKRV